MKLPAGYVTHLDHRITVLMAFTLRRDSNWFGPDHGEQKNLGDIYRASLEGSSIMLRMLIEFLGVQADKDNPLKLRESNKSDARLGAKGLLSGINPVLPGSIGTTMEAFLARLHDEASKRTAHPAFNKHTLGLDPKELRDATKWVVTEIWNRCYSPEPITIHRDLFKLMNGGLWEDIPFQEAK